MEQQSHLPHQIHIGSHSSVNLCPEIYLKAFCQHLLGSLLGRNWMDPGYLLVTLGSTFQYVPKEFFLG